MSKPKSLVSEDLNGFMDEGTELFGELRFKDTFRVDGRIKGKIVSDRTLIIGEAGHVEAEVDCGVVSIRGTVKGRVRGRERVEVLAGAKVFGSIAAPSLVIEEGAFFQGDCEMAPPQKNLVILPPPKAASAPEKA
jgi:cytoskeletal protein CcmA (bactofilin family)